MVIELVIRDELHFVGSMVMCRLEMALEFSLTKERMFDIFDTHWLEMVLGCQPTKERVLVAFRADFQRQLIKAAKVRCCGAVRSLEQMRKPNTASNPDHRVAASSS